ncbi:Ribose transport system permease protein RbsC [Polystyrenella longa]|uniref:Ribose transport system permease protein RbsC n=1 Tax=Polystyrenella longa TaxID=2528007 RepID=A0A518CNZ0_9PLAN|nr:ABC transporter permease [Polystyrenella longa]QDU80937.1 Ribose transport system permease protein RbsC [Polystyrenella longa]
MKSSSESSRWSGLIDYFGLLGVIALMMLFFGTQTENFWTLPNLFKTANQIPEFTLLAIGMTFVLIIGGIDLSVGSVFALSGVVTGVAAVQWNWPISLAMTLGVFVGGCCGFLNGFVSERWRIPSFIVTLGMLEIARGAELMIANSQTQYIGGAVEKLGMPIPGLGITPAFLIAILFVVIAQVILSKTVFGRYLFAIGNNEEAVRLSGINARPLKITVFVIAGLMAGFAGLFQVWRMGSADPAVGVGHELTAIAAAVVGGTSLTGGRGSVVKSFLGVLIIAILASGLVQMRTSFHFQRIVTGVVIVLAVILDAYRQKVTWVEFRDSFLKRKPAAR